MKSVKYTKFEPDSLIQPLWLSQLFMLLFEVLVMILLLVPIYCFLSYFNSSFALIFIFAITSILLFIFTTDMLLNVIKQTKIVDEMYLILPRKRLYVQDVSKMKIYKMRHLTGELNYVDIFLKNNKCYSVSICNVEKFSEILHNLNEGIEIVDTTKVKP